MARRRGARGDLTGFLHEAFFYSSEEEYLDGTATFIRDSAAAREPVLVAVPANRTALLRSALKGDAGSTNFVDMEELGRNPGRIIPAWREFYDRNGGGGTPIRGIGEPIWAGRTAAEVEECRRHEALLNLAFADARNFWLRCPYERGALEGEVIDDACCTHPALAERGAARKSETYLGPGAAPGPFEGSLQPAPETAGAVEFGPGDLRSVRLFISAKAKGWGLGETRTGDLVLAVNELATNSLRHGGGRGTARAWQDRNEIVCEVEDGGRIVDPLAGRRKQNPDALTGRGLWLVNQVCDLVEVRALRHGNLIRIHMRRELLTDRRPSVRAPRLIL